MSFNNVSQVVVAGPAINSVARDQFNVTTGVVNISSRANDQSTEYDEYERLKTGDIVLFEEIHRHDTSFCDCRWGKCECNRRRRGRKTIYSIELVARQSKFTAIEYKGPDAQEVWETDFRHFSQNRSPDAWQLYGLNRSRVPFLIFHDELVPLGHFYKTSFWGDFSVQWLLKKLDCHELEIWLKPEGTLIKGPEGPHLDVRIVEKFNGIPIPSSAEMLKDDIAFHFFQKLPSTMMDHQIVKFAQRHYRDFGNLESFFRKEPHVILLENTLGTLDDLRVDTVYSLSLGAVARYRDGGVLWGMRKWLGLVDETVMDDGLTRFKLDGLFVFGHLSFDYRKSESWLSQSSRIIDACRMWGTEEQCFTITPWIDIFPHARGVCRSENQPPIYLFICPPPMTMSGIKLWSRNRNHFWSLDENGRSEMTEEECRQWGVPELEMRVECYEPYVSTWPSYVYANIRNWQVARGFDPTTADFAQSLGLPELDILIDSEAVGSRFEVHKNLSIPDKQSDQSEREALDTSSAVEVAIPQTLLTTSTTEPLRITVPSNPSMVKAQLSADGTSLHGRLPVPQQKHSDLVVKASHSRIPIPTWRAQGKSWRSVSEGSTVDGSHGRLGNSGKMPKLKIQTKSTRRRS